MSDTNRAIELLMATLSGHPAVYPLCDALALQGSDSTITTAPRTLTLPNCWPTRAEHPPAPEFVVMADDLAQPPWKLDAHDAKRMPAA